MKLEEVSYSYKNLIQSSKVELIDLIKFLFAVLVVFMHTSPLHFVQPEINFLIINGICKIIVPCFFAFSGFFFFKKAAWEKSIFAYLKRLIILYWFWNVIYNILEYFFYDKDISITKFLLSFIFTTSPLWYLDALIKSIVCLALLSKFISWKNLTFIFLIVTFCYSASNFFYVNNTTNTFFSILYKLDYARVSSYLFVCIGALFGTTDISKIYKGKFLNIILIILLFLLLFESAAFKYFSISNKELHKIPQYYFVLPFLIFFFLYRIFTLKPREHIDAEKFRKQSSIIYFSHYCFRILLFYLFFKGTENAWLDMINFISVVICSYTFSFFLIRNENSKIGSFLKYIY